MNSWIATLYCQRAKSCRTHCKIMEGEGAEFLCTYRTCSRNLVNLILLYSLEEQISVKLMSHLLNFEADKYPRNLLIKNLMKELFTLWSKSKKEVVKLFKHFPCLLVCLVEYSYKNTYATKLSLSMSRANFLRTNEL